MKIFVFKKNVGFTIGITFGTPYKNAQGKIETCQQILPILIDSGSANLWVQSIECRTDFCRKIFLFFYRKVWSLGNNDNERKIQYECSTWSYIPLWTKVATCENQLQICMTSNFFIKVITNQENDSSNKDQQKKMFALQRSTNWKLDIP